MASAKTNGDSIRVTVDLSPDAHARMERLQALVRARSKADLVREALRLYEWIAQKNEQGADVVLRTKDGKEKEVILLGLDKF